MDNGELSDEDSPGPSMTIANKKLRQAMHEWRNQQSRRFGRAFQNLPPFNLAPESLQPPRPWNLGPVLGNMQAMSMELVNSQRALDQMYLYRRMLCDMHLPAMIPPGAMPAVPHIATFPQNLMPSHPMLPAPAVPVHTSFPGLVVPGSVPAVPYIPVLSAHAPMTTHPAVPSGSTPPQRKGATITPPQSTSPSEGLEPLDLSTRRPGPSSRRQAAPQGRLTAPTGSSPITPGSDSAIPRPPRAMPFQRALNKEEGEEEEEEEEVKYESLRGPHLLPAVANRKRKAPGAGPSTSSIKSPPTRKKASPWDFQLPPLRRISFLDSEERAMLCDRTGCYLVPPEPESPMEKEVLRQRLLRLFEQSTLPPVPEEIKEEVTVLRFYPTMDTLLRVFQCVPYEKVKIQRRASCLAFANFLRPTGQSMEDAVELAITVQGGEYCCLTCATKDALGNTTYIYRSSNRGKIRRHIKNHMANKDIKSHPCCLCPAAFIQKVSLQNHLRRAHPGASEIQGERGSVERKETSPSTHKAVQKLT